MDNTPSLPLPDILAAQGLKRTTHKETILAHDASAQAGMVDHDLTDPPV